MYTLRMIWQSFLNNLSNLFLEEYQTKMREDVPKNSMNNLLYNIISHYNAGETKIYYPNRHDPTGTLNAYIGKNDDATNKLVADLIVTSAASAGLDPLFLAAVINQESQFSPVCYNHNLSASRLIPSFEHTDFGISQMSGSFLPSKPGMQGLTQDQMQAKAFDPTWSIPTCANLYAGLITQAEKIMKNDEQMKNMVHELNTTNMTDSEWLSALFYNKGQTGGCNFVKTNNIDKMAHPKHCGTWFSAFQSYVTTQKFK